VVIDRGCLIPEGLEAGFDRERDARSFYVSPGGVTMITPEMLGQHIHYVR
jgi:glucose-1-phosphate adenylyltransferase